MDKEAKRKKLEVLLGPLSADTLRAMLMDIALGDNSSVREFISVKAEQLGKQGYDCPQCKVRVSPVCFNCGYDPRIG